MKPIYILSAISVLICIFLFAPVSADDLQWGPYITDTNATQTVINWKTDMPSSGTVSYTPDTYWRKYGIYSEEINSTANATLHHVKIRGLLPDTLYHYSVTTGYGKTGDLHFRTFPENGSFTFVVYGDSQEQLPLFTQLERHKLVADRIADEDNVLFVLHVGDLVCTVTDEEEWDRFFDAGRAMLANKTIYTTPGNHEKNDTAYYDTFGYPEWYSFDCGDAHYAVLDSNDWAGPRMEEETDWLRRDLNCSAEWKFASFHHPPYSSGMRHPGGWIQFRKLWSPIFEQEGVNAVFNGHVHTYERFLVNGTNYVVSGTGGGQLYTLSDKKTERSLNSCEHTLGYLKITLDAEAGEGSMNFVKVADVSEDNTNVTRLYPSGTVFESVLLKSGVNHPSANAAGDNFGIFVVCAAFAGLLLIRRLI